MSSDIKEICDRLLDAPAPPLRPAAEVVDLGHRAQRRRHARFAGAGAGVAVVAVIAAATAVPLVGRSGTAPESGFGAAAAPPSPSASAVRPGMPRSADLGEKVSGVKVSRVVSEMVAAASTVRPLPIADGQFLYVRTEGREPPAGRLHEMWLDPQGMIAMRIDIDGTDTSSGPKSDQGAEAAAARQDFIRRGPSLRMPSPQWLAGLPTDADTLLRLVDALNADTKLGGRHYELKEIAELFWECGAVLTPAVRAAFYRALGKISGVTATELQVDGRRLYALRQPDNGKGFAEELLLDPATGQVVGTRSLQTGGGKATPTALALWQYAVVGEVGQPG